jgi:hypothetical protein
MNSVGEIWYLTVVQVVVELACTDVWRDKQQL